MGPTLLKGSEPLRFATVTGAGLAIDLLIAYMLSVKVGLPMMGAATIGLLVAALANYVGHELWTFRRREGKLSFARASQYVSTVLVVLVARLSMIHVLTKALPGQGRELPILVVAIGFSFVVNYLISKFLIFGPRLAGSNALSGAPEHFGTETLPMELVPRYESWEIPAFDCVTYHSKTHRYALVIPVINEGQRIRRQLSELKKLALPVDVVVADGGSTDDSLCRDFIATVDVSAVLTKKGPGKLSAQLRMAYAWCLRNDYSGIITVDGNGKDGVEAVREFVYKLEQGFDYVQGSRYRTSGVAENTPLDRAIGNRLVHAPMLSLAGRAWFTDTTNGFRAYSARYLLDPRVAPFRDIFQEYELLFYLTVRAGQLGYSVCEVPVRRSYPVGEKTPTKISGFRSKLAILEQTVKVVAGVYHP